MSFDPSYPANNAPLQSVPMRAQLNGLKDLIDAVSGMTSAQVDAVNTLPAGSPASVVVSVSGTVLHLSFDLPQGNDGPQGIEGPPGAAGAAGTNGSDGVQGPQGPQGEPGPMGPQGPAGNEGPAGAPGANGSDGATGPQGPMGDQGPVGPQGPPGEVTDAELAAAINGSSANSNAVSVLSFGADPSYNPTQMQDVIAKINELISALRRV